MEKSFSKAREKQDYLFEEISYLLGVLASPVRLKIIHFLTQSPHSVEQLSQKIGQTIANTSMHLKKMQRENILKTETLGQKRIYSLAQEEMKDFWEEIQNFALIHNPENYLDPVEIYGEEIRWQKSLEETIKLIKARKVTLLDVRPSDEVLKSDTLYKKYVLHIPFDQLKDAKDKIPASKPLLVICRGRLCVMSSESTVYIRKLGFNAYRLDMTWYQIEKFLG